jgi:hypothetical protein
LPWSLRLVALHHDGDTATVVGLPLPHARFTIMNAPAAVAFAALCTLCHSAIATPAYQTVDVPGGTNTEIQAINDAELVAGDYTGGDGYRHGFLLSSDGTFTTFDPPGSVLTEMYGIDAAGDTVGGFRSPTVNSKDRCFIRTAAGVITTFDTRKGSTFICDASAINRTGYVAGLATRRDGRKGEAFLRGPSGHFKRFTIAAGTRATYVPPGGLNNTRTITGSTYDAGQEVGFVIARNGTVTTFSASGSKDTYVRGINEDGAIIG